MRGRPDTQELERLRRKLHEAITSAQQRCAKPDESALVAEVDAVVDRLRAARRCACAATAPSAPADRAVPLTARQREVLVRLAEGKTVKGIALELGISDKTVETHRANLAQKIGTTSIAELTRYAVRHGLVSA